IALPAVKVSIQAIVLQMAAAKAFGQENHARLDRLTVSMKHPDAMAALLSGKSEITAHLTSPPFMFQELDDRRVRTVLNSYDVLGGPHTFNVLSTTKSFRENNPKSYAAVLAALEEADAWIRKNRKGAAETYIRLTRTKESLEDIVSQISRPEVSYSTTPVNVHRFADFMHRTGAVKAKAADWKDLFFPNIHHQKGS
ncbi:MAG TPA: ABC transporter substrate-binding protein, partial [Verrucomicrobiae bacterium]|nr:ABC transporter substrate-binding protein [Verrucomicrobiae bacterium]